MLVLYNAEVREWGDEGAEYNVLCFNVLSVNCKIKSEEGRGNPDIEYAALNIGWAKNSSLSPSYLKDRIVRAILPIRLLWFYLELHSHSCSSITERRRCGLRPRLSEKPPSFLHALHSNNSDKLRVMAPYGNIFAMVTASPICAVTLALTAILLLGYRWLLPNIYWVYI